MAAAATVSLDGAAPDGRVPGGGRRSGGGAGAASGRRRLGAPLQAIVSAMARAMPGRAWRLPGLVLLGGIASLAALMVLLAQGAEPLPPPARVALGDLTARPVGGPSLLFQDAKASAGGAAPAGAAVSAMRLVAAPDEGLLERTRSHGALPRIARDGRRPWRFYARPAPPPVAGRPRLAVVVTGLGLLTDVTQQAVTGLPADVSLSFSAAQDPELVAGWLTKARQAGHEVLLDLPLQSPDWPRRDPGPLMVALTGEAPVLVDALRRTLGTGQGYVGVTLPSVTLAETPRDLAPVLEELRGRGVLVATAPAEGEQDWLAATTRAVGAAHVAMDLVLDGDDPDPEAIDRRLEQALDLARRQGQVVLQARAYPVTLEALVGLWQRRDSLDVELVPLSALATPDR